MSWDKNKTLSLSLPSEKLAMLMALRSASRCSELAYLDTSTMKCLPDGIKFTLTRHEKIPNLSIMPGLVFFSHIQRKPRLMHCAMSNMLHPKNKTLENQENRLFRGVIKPFFGPISPATIS